MCMFTCVWLCVGICVGEGKCPKRTEASDPLELELQAVVSHSVWLLGTKPGCSLQPPFFFILMLKFF